MGLKDKNAVIRTIIFFSFFLCHIYPPFTRVNSRVRCCDRATMRLVIYVCFVFNADQRISTRSVLKRTSFPYQCNVIIDYIIVSLLSTTALLGDPK